MSKFDVLYGATKDDRKAAQKTLVERKLRRNFQAQFDAADKQEIDAESAKVALFDKVENLDIEALLQAEQLKLDAIETKKVLHDMFKDLFDADIKDAAKSIEG